MTCKYQQSKGGGIAFIEEKGNLGETVINKRPMEETRSLKYSGFSLASCEGLSLAELLPGKEKIFLLMVVVKWCHFLPEMQSVSLPLWIFIDLKCYVCESSPFWPPDCFNEVFLDYVSQAGTDIFKIQKALCVRNFIVVRSFFSTTV